MDQIDFWREALVLIERYGLALVLLIAMLLWMKRWADKIMKIILQDRDASVESVMAFDKAVKGLLRECAAVFHSDWCQLWLFHNGAHGIGKTRIPFLFLSIRREVVGPGIDPMTKHFTQLPIALLEIESDNILKKQVIHHTMSDRDSVTGMAAAMRSFGAKSAYLAPVRDEDGAVVGILTIGFTDRKTLSEERQAEFEVFSRRAAIVMATMGTQDS